MDHPVRGREAIDTLLTALAGSWRGRGEGEYPTLEPFRYRDELSLTRHATDPLLHFEQRTWRNVDEVEVPSHWESGFLRFVGRGRIEMVNAQSGGRAEVLLGEAVTLGTTDPDDHARWELRLEAIEHAHDERMRAATRRWRIDRAGLDYEMHMATAGNPRLDLHLRGRLRRVSP